MLEWLRIEGDYVWYPGDTMNQESEDPDLLLSSCGFGASNFTSLGFSLLIQETEEVKLDDLWGFSQLWVCVILFQ